MTDRGSKTQAPSYDNATPITHDVLMDNFEPVIDRCAAGETFVLIRDGKAVIYMVPYEQYRRLEERANAPTKSE